MTRLGIAIPLIETERLCLREPRQEDFEAFAAFLAGPRSAMVGGPCTRFQVWRAFAAGVGHWMLRGYGLWVVTLKDSDAAIGRVGFIFNEGWGEPKLALHLFDGFEGHGYDLETAKAARSVGATKFGLDGVISYIDAENTRSRALAERLGAVFEREGSLLGDPCMIYRHPAAREARE